MKKILILASGNGSNFEAIVKYFKYKNVQIELLCDKENAFVLKRAQKLAIRAHYVKFDDTFEFLKDKKYDLYVLAGYMRILPQEVINLGTFINIHPSILPEFKGLDAIKRTYKSKRAQGVTIHFVDKDIDSGKIITQKRLQISNSMTFEEFEENIHNLEHILYPRVVEELLK